MMGFREMAACLRAVFEPADPDRKPLVNSRSIKGAIQRMECEADKLKEVALNERPARNLDEALRQVSKSER